MKKNIVKRINFKICGLLKYAIAIQPVCEKT